jgi:hypothetical protein
LKLITEQDCPNCKTHYEGEIELEGLQTAPQQKPKIQVKQIQTPQEPQIQTPQEPQIQVKTKIPSHIPKFKCKNCDKLHDNPDYSKRPKFKCQNCGSLNAGPYCQTCSKGEEFDELTDEELDELGIPEPHHEHEHEEG